MLSRWFEPNRPFAPAKWPFFYGWTILAVATLGVLASAPGQTVGMSVFADVFIETLGISRTQLTTAYLIGTGVSGFLVPWAGRWFDQMGARAFYMMAVFLLGMASGLVSQVDRVADLVGSVVPGQVWHAVVIMTLAFFVVRFLGQGLVTMGARSMLAKWWNRKRGLATSLSGVAVGAVFSAMPTFLLWELEVVGWRMAWLLNGLFLGLCMPVVAYFFFRDNPEECGLEMDGPHAGEEIGEPKNQDLLLRKEFTRAEAIRTYAFWVVALGLGLQALYATAFVFHVLDIGRTFGVPEQRIVTFFVKAVPFTIATNLLFGWAIEYIRMRYVLIALGAAGTCMAIGLLNLPSDFGQWMTIGGMGTAWGTFPILSAVTFARYFGREYLGAISGTAMSFSIWGSALGPFLFSVSKDYLGGYEFVIAAGGLGYLLLTVAAIFTSNPQRQVPAPTAEGI